MQNHHTRELISARNTSHKHNKDLSRLRELSPGMRVNTRNILSSSPEHKIRPQDGDAERDARCDFFLCGYAVSMSETEVTSKILPQRLSNIIESLPTTNF